MQTAGAIVAVNRDPDAPDRRIRRLDGRRRPVRGRGGPPRTASRPVGLTRGAGDPLMELAVLLPIAAFIALAAGLVVVLQRTGRIVARDPRARGVQGERQGPRVARRLVARWRRRPDRCRSPASARARTRSARRSRPRPTPSRDTRTRRGRCAVRARRTGSANDIIGELERAGRALGTVEHGTTMLLNSRPRELEAGDVDQARIPQPAARPRSDRPPRARRRRSSRTPTTRTGRALTPARPHHLVVSSADTTTPSGARRQESHALPPMW